MSTLTLNGPIARRDFLKFSALASGIRPAAWPIRRTALMYSIL